MRNTRLVFSSAILALAAACGGDAPLEGSFSDATVEQRNYAIETAGGASVVAGTLAIFAADLASVDPGGCIARTEDGDTVTLSARACQPGSDDASFAGTAVVRGYADFTDEDAADQMTLEFDDFALDELVMNGTIEVDSAADGSGETIVSMTVASGGQTFELHATLACEARPGTCRYRDAIGSTTAVGEFEIEGNFREGNGHLELIGDQRMVVDIAADQACARVTIDGQRVEDYCRPSDE